VMPIISLGNGHRVMGMHGDPTLLGA